MQLNVIRRKCDFCGDQKDFVKDGMTQEQEAEMGRWTTLVREFFFNGQAVPIMKHACKDSCAKNLLDTGALEFPADAAHLRQRH